MSYTTQFKWFKKPAFYNFLKTFKHHSLTYHKKYFVYYQNAILHKLERTKRGPKKLIHIK